MVTCSLLYMKTVGVGELRQNLSSYLTRVRRGERLVVTDRNRPVAELGPLRDAESAIEALIAEGRVTAPGNSGQGGPRPVPISGRARAGSAALDAVRDDS
ncbi:MAG: type II toxin-antitoxin system Phd/YefM family antitoxin [Solirubrobacterales bacterium]|nr:type II toxin-antitoxin system Phd/YefM family antitoxin [Solirubrobacterales bacterium]